VSSQGMITLFAGTGTHGYSGDGGPATAAELAWPSGISVSADDGVLIVDSVAHVVRKVSASGTIITVAGTGSAGDSGDDGMATDAELHGPSGVAATADGGFLIADSWNHVVREVSASGTITRVAGTGTLGSRGDDGAATDADLSDPSGVAVTADGGFLIADEGNHVVRKVSASGTITRVAGSGIFGNSGDNGPPLGAQLTQPSAVAVTADGGFLIADGNSGVVRKVSPSV
jgi:NHL repeat